MYKFGPFQLDPAAFRLTKDDVEVDVEPQLFNTLLLLVENFDRVVTKDELLEKIWRDRVVSTHVITRTIYELRRILDDQDNQASCIRTVRGQGYQFIADKANPSTIIQPEVKPDHKTVEVSGARRFIILGVLVGLLLSAVIISYFNPLFNSKDLNSHDMTHSVYPTVVVLPIKVQPGNEELSVLIQSLIEYLTNQLAVNLNMKVIHPDSLVTLNDQLDDIWTIQKVTRSDFILQGFVESVSDQSINLHLNLFKNNESGELTPFNLGAFEFPYPKNTNKLNNLYKQRKTTVRNIIQIIEPGVTIKDEGNTETSDPEAYRLVIAAHHMSSNDDCNALQRAENLLISAIQRDDEFAYAYYQLFANYFKRVWLCGESKEYHQKALAMAEIVERLAPGVYSPMYKGINAILIESNQVEQAFEYSKDADINDPDALNHKVYGLRYAGFLNLASEYIARILQLDPYYFSEKPINQAPNTLLYQNRFTEYMNLLATPGNSYHDYYRGLSLVLTANTTAADQILQGVVDRKSAGMFDMLSQALMCVIDSDNATAKEIVDKLYEQRQAKKHTDGEMTYKLVQLYALANENDMALETLQLAVDQGFFPMNYFLNDPALTSLRHDDRLTTIIEQATERHEAFAKKFDLEPETQLGF